MNIGEAAQAAGISAKMLRYYEKIGLIRPVVRTESGYRVYDEDDVHTLRFIRRARNLGFSMEETAELLALWRDKNRASADVKSFALKHVQELEAKIRELEAMCRTLRHLASHCHGDDRPSCPILDDMAEAAARQDLAIRDSIHGPAPVSRRLP
jgi:MerR family copper efflux transcriptional regulator